MGHSQVRQDKNKDSKGCVRLCGCYGNHLTKLERHTGRLQQFKLF